MKKITLILAVAMLCSATVFAARKKVAFVYQTGYNTNKTTYGWPAEGYTPTLDPIHTALMAVYDVTDFAYASTTFPDTATLRTYDLVVSCEAMSSGTNLSKTMVTLVGKVPMLNMKSFNYKSGTWTWGAGVNPAAKTTSVTINPGFENHAIFKDVTVTGGVVNIYDGSNTLSNMVQGFTASSPIIETNNIIANITGTSTFAIHEITALPKKYMLIPLSSDLLTTVSPNGVKLVLNACNYLLGTASVFDPTANFSIAYVYDGNYAGYCGITNDPIFNNTVIAEKNSTAINIANFTSASTDTLAAIEKYDLVVISEAVNNDHPFAKMLGGLVNRVPVLNFKAFLYDSSAWNWGAGVNPSAAATLGGIDKIKLDLESLAHPLFTDVEVIDTCITLFKNSTGILKNLVQGYTVASGSFIDGDKVLAFVKGTAATYNAIHEHGTTNKYLLLPISSEAMYLNDANNLADGTMQMINNAVYNLVQTKGSVYPAQKPTITLIYKNGVTKVLLSTLTSAGRIYYTTDGTIPTTASALYSDTLFLTSNCTLKALAAKQGFDNSLVESIDVVVKTQVATPTISIASAQKGKTITLTGAEGSTLYYTLSGATPSTAATLYSAPFDVTRPCVVKVLAIATNQLNSDIASQAVTIDGYIAREKTLVWANFNTQPTTWVWLNAAGRDTTNGDVFAKYAYTPPTEADPSLKPTLKTVDFKNGFMVGTLGQRINLQMTAVATSSSYSPFTDGDGGASDRAISFLTTNASTDPTTAYMSTTSAYPGPFDVVVWFTGARGNNALTEKLEVAVSTTNDSISTWAVLDTMSSISDRYIRKRVAYYDATTPVYVRFKSVSNLNTNSNMMIFDVKLMGEGSDPVALAKPADTQKEVVSTHIYTLSGIEVKRPVVGLNIYRTIYSDGTVKVEKIMIKNNIGY